MASAPAGEVLVTVKPDVAGFIDSLQTALEEMDPPATALLLAYTDWLDNQRRLAKSYNGGDARTPKYLVTQFLLERRAQRDAEKDAAAPTACPICGEDLMRRKTLPAGSRWCTTCQHVVSNAEDIVDHQQGVHVSLPELPNGGKFASVNREQAQSAVSYMHRGG